MKVFHSQKGEEKVLYWEDVWNKEDSKKWKQNDKDNRKESYGKGKNTVLETLLGQTDGREKGNGRQKPSPVCWNMNGIYIVPCDCFSISVGRIIQQYANYRTLDPSLWKYIFFFLYLILFLSLSFSYSKCFNFSFFSLLLFRSLSPPPPFSITETTNKRDENIFK